jgi:hypothetical protein
MRFGDQISKKRNSDLCGSSLFALKEQVLKEPRSKQAYAKREYPLKPQAEHQVVRPNLE